MPGWRNGHVRHSNISKSIAARCLREISSGHDTGAGDIVPSLPSSMFRQLQRDDMKRPGYLNGISNMPIPCSIFPSGPPGKFFR